MKAPGQGSRSAGNLRLAVQRRIERLVKHAGSRIAFGQPGVVEKIDSLLCACHHLRGDRHHHDLSAGKPAARYLCIGFGQRSPGVGVDFIVLRVADRPGARSLQALQEIADLRALVLMA